ncbi:hypothetical protein SK128_025695 [Halocaridina rubra]|uniref:BTB domain-containing protein n=1 Tax=Halocaridina rubra TaxID=373956 RepID=A0AAN8ZSN6_HALRR
MADGLLSLSWNNHKATFCHILSTLREKERYSDVTLACEGKFYPTHKLVLSTCSEYFEKMFENTPCKHPVILLSKDVRSDELEALLSYMYDGVVSVAQNDLSRLIKVAELLQIKGLAVPDEPPQPKKNYAREDRSPHPKRRKRDESLSNIPPDKALGDSTLHVSEGEHLTREGGTTDVDVSQRQEITPKHEINRVQNEGNIEETLVKEEVVETVDDAAVKDHSLEFSSEAGGNSSIVDNDQKFLQSQPLHEAVVEVLAGPSGMQGWLGTGDMGGSFPLLETYSEEGTQQETPHPVPVSVAQPAHPLII